MTLLMTCWQTTNSSEREKIILGQYEKSKEETTVKIVKDVDMFASFVVKSADVRSQKIRLSLDT